MRGQLGRMRMRGFSWAVIVAWGKYHRIPQRERLGDFGNRLATGRKTGGEAFIFC